MVLEPLFSAGGEWLPKLAPSEHPPARALSSQPCQAGALPGARSCSLQLLLCLIPRPTEQTLVSHLERLDPFHINTSRACEIKLPCMCSEQTKKGCAEQNKGTWPVGWLGIGQGWDCIGHHLFGAFFYHSYWFCFLFWPIKLEKYFTFSQFSLCLAAARLNHNTN